MKKSFLTLILLIFGTLLIPSISTAQGSCKIYNREVSTPFIGTIYPPDILGPTGKAVFVEFATRQNRVTPLQYMKFSISCPNTDLEINIPSAPLGGTASAGGNATIERIINSLRPTYKSTDIRVKVIPRSSGNLLNTTIDFYNPAAPVTGSVGSYYYPKPVNIDVIVDASSHVIMSNRKAAENDFIIDAFFHSFSSNGRKLTDLQIADEFISTGRNQCHQKGFTTELSPSPVDFGNISKSELERGQQFSRSFNIRVTRDSSCATSNPRFNMVFIHPESPAFSNNVTLNNGLMLELKSNNSPVKFNEPVKFNNRNSNVDLKFTATVSKAPGEKLISGPFSTTVIYIVEYR